MRRPSEVVLHAIWMRRLYRPALRTTQGEPVEVLYPGEARGTEGGPDFRAARLRIGELVWIGDVEIDVVPRGWYQHQHHENPAFERVVAQVVWEAEGGYEVRDKNGRLVPVVPLAPCVPEGLHQRILQSHSLFPCAGLAKEVPESLWTSLYDTEGEARLLSRHHHYRSLEDLYRAFWEALLYGFGLPTLGKAFQQLAEAVPLNMVLRYQGDSLSMEALLFGMAGLLEGQTASDHLYEKDLLARWDYLRAKHGLSPLALRWSRYRPAASPWIRLSMVVQMLLQYTELGTLIGHPPEALPLPSPYWQRHWAWQKPLPAPLRHPSVLLLQNLRINTLYPFAIYYYRLLGRVEQALDYVERLRALPPENHHISRLYARWAYPARNAWQTQGQIHLWRTRCTQQTCLSCPVGAYLRKHV